MCASSDAYVHSSTCDANGAGDGRFAADAEDGIDILGGIGAVTNIERPEDGA